MAKGYCITHYARWKRHGNPNILLKAPNGTVNIYRGYYYDGCDSNNNKLFIHRMKAEKVLGRPLKKNEVVHHINENKSDNRNCNLLICTDSYHMSIHRKLHPRIKPVCIIDKCNNKNHAYGLCQKHNWRNKKYGSPHIILKN